MLTNNDIELLESLQLPLNEVIQYRILESKQNELLESLSVSPETKQDWETIKQTLNNLYKHGKIVMTSTARTVGGAALATVDIVKLLSKMTKLFITAVTYLAKTVDRHLLNNKLHNLLSKFNEQLKKYLHINARITGRQIIILFIGISLSAGVVYNIQNIQQIEQEYEEMFFSDDLISQNRAFGIDLSHHQANYEINWEEMKDSNNLDFVILRCSDGIKTRDRKFYDFWQKATEVGLKRGTYFFFRPGQDLQEQVNTFAMHIDRIGLDNMDIIPMLDIENACYRDWRYQGTEAQKRAEYKKRIMKFLDLFHEKYGFMPVIYAGANHLVDYGLSELYTPGNKYCCTIFAAHYQTKYDQIANNPDEKMVQKIDDIRDAFSSIKPAMSEQTVMLQYTKMGTLSGVGIPKAA